MLGGILELDLAYNYVGMIIGCVGHYLYGDDSFNDIFLPLYE